MEEARVNNIRRNVTGMLVYDNATYMQVLEGSKKDVHDIYNSIVKDPRNNGHFKLVEEEISERTFPNWSMGFKSLESFSAEELAGFQDIFNGKLDKELAVDNTSKTLDLLIGFSKNARQRV